MCMREAIGVAMLIVAPSAVGVAVPPGMLLLEKTGIVINVDLGGMFPSLTAVLSGGVISMPVVIYTPISHQPFLYCSVLPTTPRFNSPYNTLVLVWST